MRYEPDVRVVVSGNPTQEDRASVSHSTTEEAPRSEPLNPALYRPAPRRLAEEYAELKRLVDRAGLFDPDPVYYIFLTLLVLGLLAASLIFLVLVDSLWLQLINAALLAFVYQQIALIGHDTGHRQITLSHRRAESIGLVVVLLLGLGRSWWVRMHNLHHSHPNQEALDPAFDVPLLAFTREQTLRRRGVFGIIVRYQAYLLLPMTLLEGFGLYLASTQFLFRGKLRYPRLEPFLIVAHFVLYFGLLLAVMSAWQAALFAGVHHALFGLFMASTFAPNHKGMPTLGKEEQMECLRQQVVTTRNVRGNPVIDFWYGGLNYQIEHHLFPNMPRNNLRQARKIIGPFCRARGIPYHETSVFGSFREILSDLHRVSATMREREPDSTKG